MKLKTTSRIPHCLRLAAGLGCLLTSPTWSQGFTLKPDKEEKGGGVFPATKMLVDGSRLQKVLIPQYDEQNRLSSLFRAEKLVLVNDRIIDAETVRLEFYHPDRSLRAGINLASARVQDQNLLRSSEAVSLEAEDLEANGTGLVYELERSRGFLFGPATARTLVDTRTSMTTPSFPHLRAGGLALVAAGALHAQEPDTLTEQEKQGLDRLAVSREKVADEAASRIAQQVEASEELAAQADASLKNFLQEAALEMEDGPKPDLRAKVPEPEVEKEFKLPASIRAKKGIFFDSESGVLVFLENVEIDHPEFTLTGADEVKVFMEKEAPKPGTEPPADKDKDLLGGAKFGDPTRMVATGTVVVERKRLKPGDKAAKASGRQMVMDLKTNELIIRGGQPWIISDTANGRVVDPDGYIMINLDSGDASFVGDSRGFLELEKEKKD